MIEQLLKDKVERWERANVGENDRWNYEHDSLDEDH